MKLLVTGASGLIGSEVCSHFALKGWKIHGIDNNQRAVFFGPQGDTRWNQSRLQQEIVGFEHHEIDIRNRDGILKLVRDVRPDAVVHTAAQPSHDRLPNVSSASARLCAFSIRLVGSRVFLSVTLTKNRKVGRVGTIVPYPPTRWGAGRPTIRSYRSTGTSLLARRVRVETRRDESPPAGGHMQVGTKAPPRRRLDLQHAANAAHRCRPWYD